MSVYVLKEIKARRGGFLLSVDGLRLDQGRVYAVAGPNGSGKTTLLNLLGFMCASWEGRLVFHGNVVVPREKDRVLERRRVGYLMQNPYLFNTTVRRNIRYGLDVRHVPRAEAEERVAAIAVELGLTHLLSANAHRLSGGEAQRVTLARTLAFDADVLLLDEPTANVDRVNIGRIEDVVGRIVHERRATVVLATHSGDQAQRLADETIWMDEGRIAVVRNVGPICNRTQSTPVVSSDRGHHI